MVLDLCGGTPSEITVAGDRRTPRIASIDFPLGEVKRLAGLDVPLRRDAARARPARLLRRRPGRDREGRDPVLAPGHRGQGRHRRGGRAHRRRRPRAARRRSSAAMRRASRCSPPSQVRTRKAKRALAARGLVEAVTWSFIAQAAGRAVRRRAGRSLRSPIRSPPTSPTCGRASFRASSRRRRRMPTAAFPTWRCSRSGRSSRATSRRISSPPRPACAARSRKASGVGRHWQHGDGEVDAFDVKADALAVLVAAGAPPQALQVVPGGPAWLHPGRSGTIQIGPQNVLGYFGELHPRALEALDAEGPLVAFEVILERIPEPKAKRDARQAAARAVAVPAGDARLRVRGRRAR